MTHPAKQSLDEAIWPSSCQVVNVYINVWIVRHGCSNEYLPFVVFCAGCYGALIRSIIMTPFACNANVPYLRSVLV